MEHRLALVTGSTGFIGTQLVRHLIQQGWRVRAGVRSSSRTAGIDSVGCELTQLDLASGEPSTITQALVGVSHVFHLAGLVVGTPAQLNQVNRNGTELLMRTLADQKTPPVVVLVSSAAATGPSAPFAPRRPSDPPFPVSDYGRSKLASEQVATQIVNIANDIPLSIVRPGIVFGEGDREFIQILQAMYRIRINATIGWGHQPLSMIDVADLCDLLVQVAERGQRVAAETPGSGIYHAADPESILLRQLGQLFRETTGRRVIDLPLPPRAGWVVGAVVEYTNRLLRRRSTLCRDKIREARCHGWVLDPSTSTEQLGWQPARSLRERLAETLQAMLADGRL